MQLALVGEKARGGEMGEEGKSPPGVADFLSSVSSFPAPLSVFFLEPAVSGDA